jgi:hypothetical protein
MFFEDMGLLIVKNHLPIQFETFNLHLCLKFVFPFKKQFSKEMFPKLIKEIK